MSRTMDLERLKPHFPWITLLVLLTMGGPEGFQQLEALAREGARTMLTVALNDEVAAYLANRIQPLPRPTWL